MTFETDSQPMLGCKAAASYNEDYYLRIGHLGPSSQSLRTPRPKLRRPLRPLIQHACPLLGWSAGSVADA
jgi:hypothetical protein